MGRSGGRAGTEPPLPSHPPPSSTPQPQPQTARIELPNRPISPNPIAISVLVSTGFEPPDGRQLELFRESSSRQSNLLTVPWFIVPSLLVSLLGSTPNSSLEAPTFNPISNGDGILDGGSSVSVEQPDTVDIISTDSATGDVVLTISDHLNWLDSVEHQLILQKKLNAYMAFVESGEILERYPDAKHRSVVFRIVFKFKPDPQERSFYQRSSRSLSLPTLLFATIISRYLTATGKVGDKLETYFVSRNWPTKRQSMPEA